MLRINAKLVRTLMVAGAVACSGGVAFASGDEGSDSHAGEHGEHADGHHDINWYYGMLGASDEIDHPTLAYRTPDMPVPFAAYAFNSAILFFLLYRFGKQPVVDALKARRNRIMQGMDEAAKMKAEAEQQLAHYRSKLDRIDAEVSRIRKEMREAAEAERVNILAEAKKRRGRMEAEAKQLIEQELKAAREALFAETVRSAMDTAERLLQQQANASDHQRLSDEYVGSLKGGLVNARGGVA